MNHKDSISCIQVVAGLHPSEGGPSRTVVQLADALAEKKDLSVSIYTQSYTGAPTVVGNNDSVKRIISKRIDILSINTGFPLRRQLYSSVKAGSRTIIHNNGAWEPANYWAAQASRHLNVPLVTQVHGMLEPWALSHKSLKKNIALWLYQRRVFDESNVLLATSSAEYENIRELGFLAPVAVIPNGIEFPKIQELRPTKDLHRTRKVLFLSRVSVKKGLINLVQAWAKVRPLGWRLQIVGPDEDNHLSQVMAEAVEAGIDKDIDYLGEIDGQEKEDIYSGADLFVLPTFSENFGVVIAEALSYGLPVITTRGAPWSDLNKFNCGWWIDIGVEPLATALEESMSLDDAVRHQMGERGKTYVRRYDWSEISSEVAEVYSWLLSKGPVPSCVKLQ